MQEFIANMMGFFFSILNENFISMQSVLAGDLSSHTEIYNLATTVQGVVQPLSTTVLAILFLIEFLKTIQRMESLNVEMIVGMLLKYVLCYTALDWAPALLEAIYASTAEWITSLGSYTDPMGLADLTDTITSAIEQMTWYEAVGFCLTGLISGLIVMFAGTSIKIMAWARMVEIYVLIALMPIPVAFSMEKGGHVTVTYFKTFAAVCVQGFLMVLCGSIYAALVTDAALSVTTTDATTMCFEITISATLLFTILKKCGSWANKIFGLHG